MTPDKPGSTEPPKLRPWQAKFIDDYLRAPKTKSLLVAPTGAGKTATVLATAARMLREGHADSLLTISDHTTLRKQWQHLARQFGLDLAGAIEEGTAGHGACATPESLRLQEASPAFGAALAARRWLIVADASAPRSHDLVALVDGLLASSPGSRVLFVSAHPPRRPSLDAGFDVDSEFLLGSVVLDLPATAARIARYAPSFPLLQRLRLGCAALDGLSWREFEKLVAELLERDGYAVELMQGRRDGGVDVVAVKDLGPHGRFKALWQAKKLDLRNKVGISVVRELADTRMELGASKGIIVTSSYLTRGARERVERDRYLLGKVDRGDLDAWIRRTLLRTGE